MMRALTVCGLVLACLLLSMTLGVTSTYIYRWSQSDDTPAIDVQLDPPALVPSVSPRAVSQTLERVEPTLLVVRQDPPPVEAERVPPENEWSIESDAVLADALNQARWKVTVRLAQALLTEINPPWVPNVLPGDQWPSQTPAGIHIGFAADSVHLVEYRGEEFRELVYPVTSPEGCFFAKVKDM